MDKRYVRIRLISGFVSMYTVPFLMYGVNNVTKPTEQKIVALNFIPMKRMRY